MTRWYPIAVLAGALALLGTPARAQAGPDLQQLMQEIQSLKAGQEAIRKELGAIRKLVQRPPAQRRPPPVEKVDMVMNVAGAPSRGAADAKLTLIEFTDYQCPFCGRHFRATQPALEKEYVDTGKLRYVLRDYPIPSLHPNAEKAAEAAYCAGEQGKYWQMHDRLFSNQRQLALAELPKHAAALGLDAAKFKACLASGRYAERVKKAVAQGAKGGVSGTPTFFIGLTEGATGNVKVLRRIRGAYPFPVFKQAIDGLLAENNKKGKAG